MRCPKCNLPVDNSKVINSRKKDGGVFRTRECSCGTRWNTMELMKDKPDDLQDKPDDLQDKQEPHPLCGSMHIVESVGEGYMVIYCKDCQAAGTIVMPDGVKTTEDDTCTCNNQEE